MVNSSKRGKLILECEVQRDRHNLLRPLQLIIAHWPAAGLRSRRIPWLNLSLYIFLLNQLFQLPKQLIRPLLVLLMSPLRNLLLLIAPDH